MLLVVTAVNNPKVQIIIPLNLIQQVANSNPSRNKLNINNITLSLSIVILSLTLVSVHKCLYWSQ